METDRVCYVTGGGGFLGGHLVRLLRQQKKRVVVIERPGFDAARMIDGVELRRADIRDKSAVREVLNDCKGALVYHLAANPHLWAADADEFEQVNHRGARHVMDLAIEHGASRVLHCSTESILTKKNWPVGKMIDEQVEILETDAVGPYCLSKLRAENYALELGRSGLPVVVANPTMPIGPDDPGPSPPTCLLIDFIQGKMPGYMECSLNLVDARDVAEGLRRVMSFGLVGRRHLLSGENVSLSELLDKLARLTSRPRPRLKVPYPVGLIYAYFSEMIADYVTGKRPQATVTGLKLARRVMHFDSSETRRLLGWEPRPLEDSLKDALAWLNCRLRID